MLVDSVSIYKWIYEFLQTKLGWLLYGCPRGSFKNSFSLSSPCKNAFLTSIWYNYRPWIIETDNKTMTIVNFFHRSKCYSTSNFWEKPWATNQALCSSIVPFELNLVLKIQRQPTTCLPMGRGMMLHVWLLSSAGSSSFIACCYTT